MLPSGRSRDCLTLRNDAGNVVEGCSRFGFVYRHAGICPNTLRIPARLQFVFAPRTAAMITGAPTAR